MDDMETMLQADGFDSALIGVAHRIGMKPCLVYSYDECIEVLMLDHDMGQDEAIEYFDFNVAGAYMGDQTPIFVTSWGELDG